MCAKIWCTNFQPSSCYRKVASLSWKHCRHFKKKNSLGPIILLMRFIFSLDLICVCDNLNRSQSVTN